MPRMIGRLSPVQIVWFLKLGVIVLVVFIEYYDRDVFLHVWFF